MIILFGFCICYQKNCTNLVAIRNPSLFLSLSSDGTVGYALFLSNKTEKMVGDALSGLLPTKTENYIF